MILATALHSLNSSAPKQSFWQGKQSHKLFQVEQHFVNQEVQADERSLVTFQESRCVGFFPLDTRSIEERNNLKAQSKFSCRRQLLIALWINKEAI